jgi:hypothetical protein
MLRASNVEKSPTSRGPEGCADKVPAAVRRLRIDSDMLRPWRLARRPILITKKGMLFRHQLASAKVGWLRRSFQNGIQYLFGLLPAKLDELLTQLGVSQR